MSDYSDYYARGNGDQSANPAKPDRQYLFVNGQQLASVGLAGNVANRTKGLLGQSAMPSDYDALLLSGASWIHTLGMKFTIDVAYLDRHNRIVALATMPPWRVGLPRWQAKGVLETATGNLAKWGLRVGTEVELRDEPAGAPAADRADDDPVTADPTNTPNPATASQTTGQIVLVATPIGNLGDLSPRAAQTLATADIIACEDTRRTGKLLELTGIQANALVCLNEHTEPEVTPDLLARAQAGQLVAVVTDAGTPGIADPPAQLVQAAAATGLDIDALPGPSALLAGLSLSGLPSGRFVFEGFLPRSGTARTQRLAALAREPRTIVLFEAPHRLKQTLRELADVLLGEPAGDPTGDPPTGSARTSRPAALLRELTKLHQQTIRAPLAELAELAAAESFPIKGEFTIVIQGAPETPPATDTELASALQAELSAGASVKDAAASAAANLGVPKRKAYALAVELQHNSPDHS